MIHRKCALVVIGAFVATTSVAPQTGPLAITDVNIVDVGNGQVMLARTVVITGNTVSEITDVAPPAGAQVLDGRGKFLIPGLWDMHAHIQGSENGWLPLYVANGVTGIRDMGADLDFILNIREATSSGRTLGPRIIAAGPILDDAPGDWPLRIRVKTVEEGRAAVRLSKGRGVDLINVHNFTPRDVFFAIAEEARRQSLPLAGHVPLKVTIQEPPALENIRVLSEPVAPSAMRMPISRSPHNAAQRRDPDARSRDQPARELRGAA